jgi:hypothetical protein
MDESLCEYSSAGTRERASDGKGWPRLQCSCRRMPHGTPSHEKDGSFRVFNGRTKQWKEHQVKR